MNFRWISGYLMVAFLMACNQKEQDFLAQIEQLKIQVDSIEAVYAKINWSEWEEINKKVNEDVVHVSELIDEALKIDPQFIDYYGSYSTSGKIISRILRKSKSIPDEEINLSKKQLHDLVIDIKSNSQIPIDSIPIYIGEEAKAVEKLVFEISTLENTLNEQKEAYLLTNEKVQKIIEKLKLKHPEMFVTQVDFKFNEDEHHE